MKTSITHTCHLHPFAKVGQNCGIHVARIFPEGTGALAFFLGGGAQGSMTFFLVYLFHIKHYFFLWGAPGEMHWERVGGTWPLQPPPPPPPIATHQVINSMIVL